MTDQRRNVILRQYKETDAQFATREFNYCMYQLSRCHELQAERIRMNWIGPAIFYQHQSAEWYERAVECRARHDQALAALIPGTQVRWDEIFTNRYPFLIGPGRIQYFNLPGSAELTSDDISKRGPRQTWYFMDESRFIGDAIDELLKSPDIPNDARKLASSTAYGRINKPVIVTNYASGVFEKSRDHGMTRKWQPTPKEKYDNPRDVPLTLKEISDQLKRWLA